MSRTATLVVLMSVALSLALSQTPEALPKFEIADVHISAKMPNPYFRIVPVRDRRYELKNATMVDLIRTAWDIDADKVVGGPSWLEMNRFDILAKLPANPTPETQRLMLQSLLADRFNLVVHKDSRPFPNYALTVGKKPQLKAAEGTEETGCKIQTASGPPAEGGGRLMMMNASGTVTTIDLGPGFIIRYNCRNMTMAAFADGLRGMMGTSLGSSRVLDETGLEGRWNFDLRFSLQLTGLSTPDAGERVSLAEAIDKQLGLKLEEKQIPTPVVVVDSVNEKPSENPPGLAEALPPIPVPTEFEVASIKPVEPTSMPTIMGSRMQPGGRFVAQGMSVRMLVSSAFNINSSDQVAGLPKWADTDRYDINAKAPSEGPSSAPLGMDAVAPMIRALLVERFKMKYHTEEQPVTTYSLVAAKPKMKKADPASRASCKNVSPPAGAPAGSRTLNCQNITMAQFADGLQRITSELTWPVLNATGIDGGWDFSLTFSMIPRAATSPFGRGGEIAGQSAGSVPTAADPVASLTIFEALEKQLGLKLEAQKRPMPVIVIDHIEQKPTED